MNRSCLRPSSLATALTLVLGGCGNDESGSGGSAGTGGQPMLDGLGVTNGQGGSGAAMNGGAGSPGSGGTEATPAGGTQDGGSSNEVGAGMPTGMMGGEGGVGASEAGGAGSGGDAGHEGGAGSGGDAAGGQGPVGGSGGEGMGGEGAGGGMPVSTECTRELLDGLTDDYFAALSAGDPSSLPLSASLKFTENAQETEIGTTDFWMNAGDLAYSQRALDTELCSVALHGVVPEGATDRPIALRIKVEAGKITEIESIVIRPGDYDASFAVASMPARIIQLGEEIGWNDDVPEGDRASREELAAWMDKYFRAFPGGVCNTSDACIRLENGGYNQSCSGAGATCAANTPGDDDSQMLPRVIVVDEVRGISAGLTLFNYSTEGHLDMHMMKMSGEQVHAVQAILGNYGGVSGWE